MAAMATIPRTDEPEERARGAARVEARPAFRPRRKVPWGKLAIAVAALAAIGGAVAKRMQPKPVTTTRVVRGVAVEAVYATGTVEAFDRLTVKAKTTGSVLELKVREGARVKKGDLLATIDSPTLKFELAKGKADLFAASSQAGAASPQLAALEAQMKATSALLASARADRDRFQKLVQQGTATQVELDKANTQVANLEAQLAAQKAQQASLRIDLGARASGANAAVDSISARLADTEVRSPLDGVVLGRTIDAGEVVMLNQPLFRVGNTDDLVLECAIDEADVAKVAIGSKAAVSLYAFSGKTFKASVFEVLPDADRAKKSFLTKLRLTDAPPGLRSGMSAEVNVIVAERAGSLLAPAEGIDASGYAWIANNGVAERRKLTVGSRDMLRAEVLAGVSEGDQIVVSGADLLQPGVKVKATDKAPEATVPPANRPKAGL
jgi:HlyD family secretion protein